jgi:hypothetical protein
MPGFLKGLVFFLYFEDPAFPAFYPLDNTGRNVFTAPFQGFLAADPQQITGRQPARSAAFAGGGKIRGPGEGLYPYSPLNMLFQDTVRHSDSLST